ITSPPSGGASLPPRPLDGISLLLPLIGGKESSRPVPLCFHYTEPKRTMHESPMIAMIEGRYKFLTNYSADGKEDLLYDLFADRGETKNIVDSHLPLARSMKKRLREWIESCKASYSGAD